MAVTLSVGLPPHRDVVEHARLAEQLGYDRFWLFDSPALYGDVWVALARVAEATDIKIGTAVLVPSLRHVLTTASAIATIEELAPGRLAVAIGTGFTGRRMLGQKPLTWKSTGRYVSDLRALLRGEDVVVDGAAVRMCHPEGFAPARPIETPIVVAANGPLGLEVARELGDGVMCVAAPQPGFDWCTLLSVGTVLDPGETAETPRAFEAIGPYLAVVYHATYEATGEAVDNLPGGKSWREEVEKFPESLRHMYVHEGHFVEMTDRDRRHVSPALAGTTLTGSPDEIRARVDALEQGGLHELVYTPFGDVPRELRSMAETLLP